MSRYQYHTEDVLLSLLKEDDEQAFTEIYNRYWKRLFALAYERLKSKQQAEDVVHEVFTSLWQRRHKAAIQSLNAWLAAATKYATLKIYSGFLQNTVQVSETSLEEADSVHAYIDSRFLEQMIREELNRLPNKCRLVFEYSRQHCLSNKEIANELGISPKAVEKHITRALRQLRLGLKSLHQFLPFW